MCQAEFAHGTFKFVWISFTIDIDRISSDMTDNGIGYICLWANCCCRPMFSTSFHVIRGLSGLGTWVVAAVKL